MKNIIKLLKYIDPKKSQIFIIFVLAAATSALSVSVPLIFRNIINQLSRLGSDNFQSSIYQSLIILAAVLALNQIVLFFIEKYTAITRIKMLTTARVKIMEHLLKLSVDYTERNRPGSILQRYTQGLNDFFQWFFELTIWFSDLLFRTIFTIIVLYFALPAAGLGFTFVVPLMVLISLQKSKATLKNRKRANKYYEKQAGYITEVISHLPTIKSMSTQNSTTKTFKNYQSNILSNRLNQFKKERWYNLIRDSIGDISVLLAIIYVTIMAINGKLSPGDVFLIAFYARDIIGSTQPIGRFLNTTADTDVTAERIVKIIESKPTIVDKINSKELQNLKSIEFKNVSFEYPDSKKGAISNISFKIYAGKSLALVGPSGTGKSTITKLILRFYEPTSGKILINNEEIHNFTQESIRYHLGIVMQDVALFNTTLKENLKIAKENASDLEIQKAAQLANAEEFIINSSKGYDTLVGERGIKLSGGQKQRIAIARTILKNPNMIILDEATSALDSESEKLVQDALKKLLYHKMSLIIAHRLSTVRHVDEIIVLKNGRIYERGTHTSLLRKKGLYAKLFNIQSKTGKVDL
jgi:ABC-type multidrug transport system fused ATPase/permease subunit